MHDTFLLMLIAQAVAAGIFLFVGLLGVTKARKKIDAARYDAAEARAALAEMQQAASQQDARKLEQLHEIVKLRNEVTTLRGRLDSADIANTRMRRQLHQLRVQHAEEMQS